MKEPLTDYHNATKPEVLTYFMELHWVQIDQNCKAKKHTKVRTEVTRLSLVVENNKCRLLSIKREAEKTWWFPPTTPYTGNQYLTPLGHMCCS